MSVTSYINYHRRPHAQYMTVAEYNNKNNTNVEVPAGFENEFESALMDARRVTDPNDFIQHSFTNMAARRRRGGGRRSGGRRRGGVSNGLRKGPGLSGKKAGRTYTQWTPSRIKGSVRRRPGTVPGALRNKGRIGPEDVPDKIEEVLEAMGVKTINLEGRAGQTKYPDLRRDKESLDDIPAMKRWATAVMNTLNKFKDTANTMNEDEIRQAYQILTNISHDVFKTRVPERNKINSGLPRDWQQRMEELYSDAYDALKDALDNLPAAKIVNKGLSLTDFDTTVNDDDKEDLNSELISALRSTAALPKTISLSKVRNELQRIALNPLDGEFLKNQLFLAKLARLANDGGVPREVIQKLAPLFKSATNAVFEATRALKNTAEDTSDAIKQAMEQVEPEDEQSSPSDKTAEELAAERKKAEEKQSLMNDLAEVLFKDRKGDKLAPLEPYTRLQDVKGKLNRSIKKAKDTKLDKDAEIIKAIEQATSRRDSFAEKKKKEKEIAEKKKKENAKQQKPAEKPAQKVVGTRSQTKKTKKNNPNPVQEEADLDAFLDDYDEDVTYEEVAPGDDTFDEELEAFLASGDESPPAAAPKKSVTYANEPSLDSRIDSFLSEAAQDSETFARDRAHVIHFATGSGSLKSQLMKGRERYLERLSAFLDGDNTVKVRMLDNKEVLVSSLRPNRSSLRSMLKEKPGAPRYCKCD